MNAVHRDTLARAMYLYSLWMHMTHNEAALPWLELTHQERRAWLVIADS